MKSALDVIDSHYVDARGTRRQTPRAAREAIRRSMGLDATAPGFRPPHDPAAPASRGKAAPAPVTVVTEGDAAAIGPAEVCFEDGTTLAIDDRLPRSVPAGYHVVRRRNGMTAPLIVAPARCFLPESLRTWGWAIQLYAARSRRSWGIGDLADLRRLGRWAAKGGARIALVNPLAAPSPTLPQQESPYLPSSRRFRSPLYLRVEEVGGADTLDNLPAIAARGRALNANRLIARDDVFRLKVPALERIWDVIRRRELPALDAFVKEQGSGLREFATFCALAEQFQSGWHEWRPEFRHPSSPAVRDAARRQQTADRIRFHEWLQFEVDRQLARASRALPLVHDLPVGFAADGADGWIFQDVLAQGISVGAPPDAGNTNGEDWGLPPFVPSRLREAGYRPFIDTVRASLCHAGGLRIDHVMGLFRLFWIPRGMEPKHGAYVRSDARALLAIVAIESQRARAIVVSDDPGAEEDEARAELRARGILAGRLLGLERRSPATYPAQTLAAVTTRDQPTIAGLWTGSDLAAQKVMGRTPDEAGARRILARVRRLARSAAGAPLPIVIPRVYRALATAPSRIVTATLEDAMTVEERPSMPGATAAEWPNWSIALPRPIETLDRNRVAARIVRALDRRGRR